MIEYLKKDVFRVTGDISKTAQVIYRVARNKIPHQTICNIFATSGQILKILEAI